MMILFVKLTIHVKVCCGLLSVNVFTENLVLNLGSSALPFVGRTLHVMLPCLAFLP
jgi:hypothetical protein